MEDVLFLAHVEEGGAVSPAALEALSVARQLAEGGKLTVGLIGGATGKAAGAIGGCGASRWLAVEGEAFTQARYGSDVRMPGAKEEKTDHNAAGDRVYPRPG